MSRHCEDSGGGIGFWGFLLALIAGAYIFSIEPADKVELAADVDIAVPTAPTTAPPHTHPAPTTTTTAPPPTFGSGGRDLTPRDDDSLTDQARELSECMITPPWSPLLCLSRAVD